MLGEYARRFALQHGLDAVEVVTGDASKTSVYAGMVPADLVLACGIFGNVSDSDIERTVREMPRFTKPGGTVLWTRHRKPPDMTTNIRRWFEECGFEEVGFDGDGFGVGTHRFTGTPEPFRPDQKLFSSIAMA